MDSDCDAESAGNACRPMTPIDTVRKKRIVVMTGYSTTVVFSARWSLAAMSFWKSCGNMGSAKNHRKRNPNHTPGLMEPSWPGRPYSAGNEARTSSFTCTKPPLCRAISANPAVVKAMIMIDCTTSVHATECIPPSTTYAMMQPVTSTAPAA